MSNRGRLPMLLALVPRVLKCEHCQGFPTFLSLFFQWLHFLEACSMTLCLSLPQIFGFFMNLVLVRQEVILILVYIWLFWNPFICMNVFGHPIVHSLFLPWTVRGFAVLRENSSIIVDLLTMLCHCQCSEQPTTKRAMASSAHILGQ